MGEEHKDSFQGEIKGSEPILVLTLAMARVSLDYSYDHWGGKVKVSVEYESFDLYLNHGTILV